MRSRGRPVRGAFSGFFTGLFVAIDLMFFGSITTDSVLVTALPVGGLVLGFALGLWAPFGRMRTPAAAPITGAPDVSSFAGTPASTPRPPLGDPTPPPASPESPPTETNQ
jgi:hypothetical protein